nr:hypothetical protein BaRGS_011939 [Batillaria attramentaria]
MRQDRDEPVRAFAARLRGQAGVCNFRVNPSLACHAEVDYSNIMIRDVLIRGLEDEEIRLDILGESRQDMSLEDALQYVEAKESGKSFPTIGETSNLHSTSDEPATGAPAPYPAPAYPACSAHHHPTYSCQLFSATGPQSTDASS